MEVADRLRPILTRCEWAGSIEALLGIVPELAEEIPPLERVPGSRVDGPGIPLPGASSVLAGVATFMCSTLEDTKVVDGLVDARESSVRDDPVVHALVTMWQDADRPGSQVMILPALSAAWALSGLLGEDAELMGHLPGPLATRCVERLRQLRGTYASATLGIESRLASRLSARVGAAITLSRTGGVNIPAGGVIRRILMNPLVSLYRPQRLDPRRDFVRVCNLLRAPMDPGLVELLFEAGKLAWSEVNQRIAGRKPRPVDRLLGTMRTPGDATSVLLDPMLGPGLLRCLGDLVDVKTLRGVGFDARMAKQLLNDQALRPLSGAWGDVVRPLRSWRVLSAVVDQIAPLWSGTEGDEEVTQPRSISARWSLRVPGGLGVRPHHAVVATRFADIISSSQSSPERTRAVLRRVWDAKLREVNDALWAWTADVGIAVFPSPSSALLFAESLRNSIPGAEGMLNDVVEGPPVVIHPGLRLAIGMDWGRVDGGTDGLTTWLEGPAVTGAMQLLGAGPPVESVNDPLGIRSVTTELTGLKSQGILASSNFVRSTERGITSSVHRHGDEVEVAGASTDFRLYPVPMWWESAGTVRMWVELGVRRCDGPAELVVMNRLMFRDIHRRDSEMDPAPVSGDVEATGQYGCVDDDTDVIVQKGRGNDSWDPFLSGDRVVQKTRTLSDDPWGGMDSEPDLEIDE